MLEEAPGRVAFLTRSLTRDRAKKIDLLYLFSRAMPLQGERQNW